MQSIHRNTNMVCAHSYVDIRHKAKVNQHTGYNPRKPGNKEDTKRDVHEFLWEGKVDKIKF